MVQKLKRLVGFINIRAAILLVLFLFLATVVFSIAQEAFTNHLWMSVRAPEQSRTNGIEFSAHIPAGFTNTIEVFVCTNLAEQDWHLALTNMATIGTGVVVWSDSEFTNLNRGYVMCVNAEQDTDGDQIPDGRERLLHHTDMNTADSDGDGMPDGWEVSFGLDPLQDDTTGDADGDGIENAAEYRAGASPLSANTAKYLCDTFLDIQCKTISASRSKCGYLAFVQDSNPPILHLYKTLTEDYGGEFHRSGDWGEESVNSSLHIVTEWDGSTCSNWTTGSGIHAGEYDSSSMECSFSRQWDNEHGWQCTNSQSGPDINYCGVAGYTCYSPKYAPSLWHAICYTETVYLSATEIRRESTTTEGDSTEQCWSYSTLSSEYTTEELLSRVQGDLGYCGGFSDLSWDYDRSGSSFNAPSTCNSGASGFSAFRDLSTDETSLALCKMQYRVGLSTEADVVYRIEWIEWFRPEDDSDPIGTHMVDYIRGNGDMAYTRPHTVDAPSEDGCVFVDSASPEIGIASLTPNQGSEVDDGDGNADTRLFVVCADRGKRINVTARLTPSWANTYLPNCFTLSGGLDGSNRRERQVDISAGGSCTIYASIGSSYKQTTIAVRKADIEQTTTNVCIDCGQSVTLSLTSDSYSPSGFTWDSVPSGISGTGTSISFCPTNLSAGTYTVQAYPTGMASCDDECEVTVVKVDIETDETNVCADCGDPITLKLTTDSYSPNGFVWSSTPPGISGTGSSITFTPTNLSPNAYIVKAKSADLPDSCYEECIINVIRVESLLPDVGQEIDDQDGNPDTKTFVASISSNAGDVVTVTAIPNPSISEANLPTCWIYDVTEGMASGSGKLERRIDRTIASKTILNCSCCGANGKVTTVYVVDCRFTAYADAIGLIGHSWWCLELLPTTATVLLQPITVRIWVNVEAGYFPATIGNPHGPGYVKRGPQGHTATSQHTWGLSYDQLCAGVIYTANLAATPGTYDLLSHNCTHEAVAAAGASGVTIPGNVTTPQEMHDWLTANFP